MKRLLKIGNQYVAESDWKDLALIKFCLCARGILIGVHVGSRQKKAVTAAAGGVFAVTYAVLMAKLLRIVFRKED